MRHRNFVLAALIAAAGAAACALAQDSVSKNGNPQAAGAGDALPPWDLRFQCEEYVVHTAPIQSAWGTRFAVAPLIKSSKTDPAFENSLISAQAISRCYAPGVLKDQYETWQGLGLGANDDQNNAPGVTVPGFSSMQFGATFAEFSGNHNGVISAVVNVCRTDPTALYVNRFVAATNGVDASGNSAQFGIGAVDGMGNVAIRADGTGGGANSILGDNIFCVDSKARDCDLVNQIANFGAGNSAADLGATSYKIVNNAQVHNTPNLIPEELCGVKKYIGTNFVSQYVFNDGASTTMAHLVAPFTDHRGSLAFSKKPLVPNTPGVASAAILAKPNGGDTTGVSLWNIDCDGAIQGAPRALIAPAVVVDACTGYSFPFNGMDSLGNPVVREFDHYHSQTAYRGGVSQIGLGCDRDGNAIVVAEANKSGNITDAENGLVGARVTPGGVQWSMVAYNGEFNFVFTGAGRGKPVLDAPGGNEIGYIATLFELTNGSRLGPSISAGSVDSVGNVWFVAPVWFPADLPASDEDFVDPLDIDTCLIRGVLRDVQGQPCWDLEVVLRAGDVVTGEDSTVNWRLGFINIADSNSVDSGGFWSQNAMQDAYFGMDPAALSPTSNRTTGGVVLNCEIAYDRNNDGMFSTTSEAAGDGDEEYAVLLYVGPDAPTCTADINGDGTVNTADLGVLISQFNTAGPAADLNCDGTVNTADLGVLIGQFGSLGCQ